MKKFLIGLLVFLALYSRLVGITWGLPYPMHPDERNMAVAVQSLKFSEQLNPHFFAYGQLPLYIAYFFIQFLSFILQGAQKGNISFESATIALRYLSVLSSWASLWIIYRILNDFFREYFGKWSLIVGMFLFVFSPYAIQFAHFGTTESLLTCFYLGILYFSIQIGVKKEITRRTLLSLGTLAGLAIGTKISSATFLALPLLVVTWTLYKTKAKLYLFLLNFIKQISILTFVTILFAFLASPHMLISTLDFISTITYESKIASGAIAVFYTRQFLFSIPVIYQLTNIFPVALGIGTFVLFLGGFIFLNWRDTRLVILRLAFLLYFIPSSFLFVKWTRFEAPALAIASIFGMLFLSSISLHLRNYKVKRIFLGVSIFFISLPGIAYISIYQNHDVRFQASNWIFDTIPEQAQIFSEAGNVINIPVPAKAGRIIPNHHIINFDFYQVDGDKMLQTTLVQAMKEADYIIVPSQRVVGSVTCSMESEKNNLGYSHRRCVDLKRLFPVTNEYYDKLLSGELGYSEIKRFTSYPKIELFGKTLIEFPDEQYDETWSVFDHPVIRIYKRT